MGNIHENQVGKVLPYQFERDAGENASNLSDECDADKDSELSS